MPRPVARARAEHRELRRDPPRVGLLKARPPASRDQLGIADPATKSASRHVVDPMPVFGEPSTGNPLRARLRNPHAPRDLRARLRNPHAPREDGGHAERFDVGAAGLRILVARKAGTPTVLSRSLIGQDTVPSLFFFHTSDNRRLPGAIVTRCPRNSPVPIPLLQSPKFLEFLHLVFGALPTETLFGRFRGAQKVLWCQFVDVLR